MLRKFRALQPGEFIVVGCDTSAGGGDYCAAQFISQTKIDVPWVYHSKSSATEMTNDLVSILSEIYQTTGIPPEIAYERNNGGSFEMERLATLNRSGHFIPFKMPIVGNVHASESTKYGWDTNSASRPAMLSQLKDAVDKQALRIYDKRTIEEMFAFVVVKTSSSWKAQAEDGAHDDLVMALAIAWQLYGMCRPQRNEVNQQVRQMLYERIDESF